MVVGYHILPNECNNIRYNMPIFDGLKYNAICLFHFIFVINANNITKYEYYSLHKIN